MDEACLFDDLAEVEKRLGQGNLAAGTALSGADLAMQCSVGDEQGGLNRDCVTTATVLGYHNVYDTALRAAPVYLTSDGVAVDLAAMSCSCDLTPLHIQQGPGDVQSEEQDVDKQEVDLSSMYSIITSTGFVLE